MASSKKRKISSPDISSLNLPDIATRVLQLGDNEVRLAAIHKLIQLVDIDISELQNVGKDNPSFSGAIWKVVAPQFGLDPNRGITQLEKFEVPSAILPPSFHRKVMTESLERLNVYQAWDATRGRKGTPYGCGRLVDKPESRMPATPQTSGGEVEHEVSMSEGILLHLTELKLYFKSMKDHLAQVFLELVSIFKRNSGRNLDPQPPVYAILTDLEKFYFLSYDGSKFTRMSTINVNIEESQEEFLFGMARVAERLFSVLLHAYIGVLTAVQKRSASGQDGDTTKPSSAALVPTTLRTTRNAAKLMAMKRPSTDMWSQALAKSLSAQNLLSSCQRQPIDEWEKAENGLKVLFESVRHLDKIGSEEDWDDDEIGQYIGGTLSRMSKELKVVVS